MKRTISKKIIIALLSALVAASMGFAVLLSRPATQANAEERYSETWVINEKWDYSKTFSTEINGRVSYGSELEEYRKFGKFEIVDSSDCIRLNCGDFSIAMVKDEIRTFQNIPQCQEMNYYDWKSDCGKVTFYSDTSATEYAELRTWLEANAVKIELYDLKVVRLNDGEIFEIQTSATTIGEVDFSSLPTNFNGSDLAYISNNIVGGADIAALPTNYPVNEDSKFCVTYKTDITATIKDGETVKGTLTFPYDIRMCQIDLSPLGDLEKDGFVLTGVYFGEIGLSEGNPFYSAAMTNIGTLQYVEPHTVSIRMKTENLETVTVQAGTKFSELNLEEYFVKEGYKIKGYTFGNSGNAEIPPYYRIRGNEYIAAIYAPTYTLTFMNGEDVLGTVEATEGAKLSALDMSSISAVKEGYTFKGWSYEENGELIDLEAETVTEAKTLYAVYEKNTEPTEPEQPDNPAQPDKPSDSSNTNEVKKVIGITFGLLFVALAVAIVFRVKHYRKK